jgi:hypothetical protein
MKKKIQRAEVTEEFKDPNDRVMKLITSDVLEVSCFYALEILEKTLSYCQLYFEVITSSNGY